MPRKKGQKRIALAKRNSAKSSKPEQVKIRVGQEFQVRSQQKFLFFFLFMLKISSFYIKSNHEMFFATPNKATVPEWVAPSRTVCLWNPPAARLNDNRVEKFVSEAVDQFDIGQEKALGSRLSREKKKHIFFRDSALQRLQC